MDNETQPLALYILIEAIKSLLLLIMAAFLFFNSFWGLIILSPYVLFSVYRIARKAGERQRRLLIRYFKDMLSCLLFTRILLRPAAVAAVIADELL